MNSFWNLPEAKFRNFFWFLFGLICLLRVATFKDYGVTPDEASYIGLGEYAYKFYASFGSNDSVFHYIPKADDQALMDNYGPFLDILPVATQKVIGGNIYNHRHFWIMLFSTMLFLFTGLTAQKIAGWRAGLIALILISIHPRIFAESFNNPKDPTFAAGYICAIYFILCFIKELPRPSWKMTIYLALGVGSALISRIGGLLILPYLALFLALEVFTNKELKETILGNKENALKDLIIKLAVVGAGGFMLGILFWPKALVAPFSHPFKALTTHSQFPIYIKTLFEGKWVFSNQVPQYYILKYFVISSPEIVILGFIIGIILIKKLIAEFGFNRIALVLFISVFPLLYVWKKGSFFYTGWRHSYFMFLGITIFAALAFEYVFRKYSDKIRYGAMALLAIGVFLPVRFIAANHPNYYVYFNTLSGGIEKNYGDYEIDYYHHSLNSAAIWMEKNLPGVFKDTSINIVSNAPWSFLQDIKRFDEKRWGMNYVRYRERNESDWDYAVLIPAFVESNIMKEGYFKLKGTIHTIDIDGKPICVIVKRENKDDFKGIELESRGDFLNAIPLLESAVKYDPNNEIALTHLGVCYVNSNQPQPAIQALTKALQINPESHSAMNALGYAYLGIKDYNNAIFAFEKLIQIVPNMSEPYNILSQLYGQIGQQGTAQSYGQQYQRMRQAGM